MDMGRRWTRLWQAVGGEGDGAEAFARIAAEYARPERAYHTLAHVHHCLRELDTAREADTNVTALEWALWFHDAVYVPGQHDNEERSAEFSDRVAETVGNRSFAPDAHRLILATRIGREPEADDERLLVDIDYSILSAPPSAFEEYALGIRCEYAFVPWRDYVSHRTGFLRSLLARPRLFWTDYYQVRFDGHARANLVRALDRLATESDPLLSA